MGEARMVVMRILELDATSANRTVLRSVHQCYLDMEHELMPDQPATPFEEHEADWQAPARAHRKDLRWIALEDDQVIGTSHAVTWSDHAESGLVEVAVLDGKRRRGAGSELLLAALGGLESEGRSKLIVDLPTGSPHEPYAEDLGLRRVFSERVSQLIVAEIDWMLMDTWIDRASERAPDYEILAMRSPLPQEHLENWCRISDAMNTAPLEEFDLEDTHMTPGKLRSIEANLSAKGYDLHALVAVHKPTGEFAGMTTLLYQRHHPEIAQQDDTVVDPAHRNRGLGRLLKAQMAKDFLREHADVERINTGNAGSNQPMLAINEAMGFKAILEISAWQGDIATAKEALASRP